MNKFSSKVTMYLPTSPTYLYYIDILNKWQVKPFQGIFQLKTSKYFNIYLYLVASVGVRCFSLLNERRIKQTLTPSHIAQKKRARVLWLLQSICCRIRTKKRWKFLTPSPPKLYTGVSVFIHGNIKAIKRKTAEKSNIKSIDIKLCPFVRLYRIRDVFFFLIYFLFFFCF